MIARSVMVASSPTSACDGEGAHAKHGVGGDRGGIGSPSTPSAVPLPRFAVRMPVRTLAYSVTLAPFGVRHRLDRRCGRRGAALRLACRPAPRIGAHQAKQVPDAIAENDEIDDHERESSDSATPGEPIGETESTVRSNP